MTDEAGVARRQIRGGIGRLGAALAAVRVIDIAASFYLLRLLTEQQMGIAALAGSVTIILESLCGLGLRTSIVAASSITEEERDDLVGLTTSTGLLFCLVAILVAWPMAVIYDEPLLTGLIAASSLKLLLVSIAVVPQSLLSRDLAFSALAWLQVGAAAAAALTKVGLAIGGFGAWSLIWSNVASGVAMLLGTWIFRWPGWPRLRFRVANVRSHIRFGARATLSNFLTEISKNVDFFMVGLVLGMGPLGIYRVAFDIAMTPLESIAQPIYRVTFSVFSRESMDRARLEQAFIDATRSLVAMAGPVTIVLYFATDSLFELLTDVDWKASVPAVEILCWAALLRTVTRLFDNLFYARREPGTALLDAAMSFSLLVVGMPVCLWAFGEKYGVLVPSYVWLATYPIVYAVLFTIALKREALDPRRYLRGIAPAALGTAATFVVAGLVEHLSARWGSPLARSTAVSGAAALTYVLTVRSSALFSRSRGARKAE